MSFTHNKALDFKAGILILDLTDISPLSSEIKL